MLKRWLVSLLAVAMLLGTAGCSKGGNPQVAYEDDESKPYNIVWYYIGGTETKDQKLVNEKVNEITKKKINATVEMIPIDWGSYESKMNPIIASSEEFDLCFASNWILLLDQNIQRNAFRNIKNDVEKYGKDIISVLGEDTYNLAVDTSKDALWYVPTYKDLPISWGFMYRKDLVEKYNIDIENINSYEELLPALDTIKKNEPKVIPTLINGGSGSPMSLIDFSMFVYPCGFFNNKEIGVVQNYVETDDYREAALMCRKLYTEGYIRKDNNLLDSAQVDTMKKNGDFFCWVEQLKPGKDGEVSEGKRHQYVQHMVTPPKMDGGNVQGATLCVSRTSKNPARTVKFINLLYSDPELLNLINYGIEGMHYKKIGENRIEKIDGAGYNRAGMQWMFGDTTRCYLLPTDADDKNEKMREFNKSAKPSVYTNLPSIDTLSLKMEMATCNTVKNEYNPLISSGTVDPDEYLPKFSKKLKESGSDKIFEAFKKSGDEFLKTYKPEN